MNIRKMYYDWLLKKKLAKEYTERKAKEKKLEKETIAEKNARWQARRDKKIPYM